MLARVRFCATGVCALLLITPLAGCGPRAAPTVESAAGCVDHDWGYHDDHFGTKNACNTPISIWFMQRDGSVMHADVAAGEPFDSGLTANDMAGKDWDHAVCPAGFEPEPALSAATFDKVHNDEYSCARAAS